MTHSGQVSSCLSSNTTCNTTHTFPSIVTWPSPSETEQHRTRTGSSFLNTFSVKQWGGCALEPHLRLQLCPASLPLPSAHLSQLHIILPPILRSPECYCTQREDWRGFQDSAFRRPPPTPELDLRGNVSLVCNWCHVWSEQTFVHDASPKARHQQISHHFILVLGDPVASYLWKIWSGLQIRR